MLSSQTVFHYTPPSFQEMRESRRLMVWGELAQWLVVDQELYDFIGLFDGKRPLGEIVRAHARNYQQSIEQANAAASQIIPALCDRHILRTDPAPFAFDDETLSIANVTINITNKCNLKCTWCYNADHRTDEMAADQLMSALEQGKSIYQNDCSFIILGGEPCLDADRLLYILDRANEIFTPAVQVSTNGTLVTPQLAKELAKRRVNMQVSIDSYCAEKHDAIRGEGVFAKACQAVRYLANEGVPVNTSMVFSKDNLEEMEPYLDMSKEIGADEARFIPLRLIGRGLDHTESLPDFLKTFRHLLGILERRPELAKLLGRDFFSILISMCRFSMPRSGCGVGRRVLFIDADGKVYPCPNHLYPEYECGDLNEKPLTKVWNTSPCISTLRDQYKVENYTACQSCSFRHWCAGDCRGEVLSITGKQTAPSPHCKELRQIMVEAFWMITDKNPLLGIKQTTPDGKPINELFSV